MIKNEPYFVYFFESSMNIKIGISFDWENRLKTIQKMSGDEIKCIGVVKLENRVEATRYEKFFHLMFRNLRVYGEWFKKDETLLNFIKNGSVNILNQVVDFPVEEIIEAEVIEKEVEIPLLRSKYYKR